MANFGYLRKRRDIIGIRSVRRIPEEDKWGVDCINWVKRPPWNRYHGAEDADGEVPEELFVTTDASSHSWGRWWRQSGQTGNTGNEAWGFWVLHE